MGENHNPRPARVAQHVSGMDLSRKKEYPSEDSIDRDRKGKSEIKNDNDVTAAPIYGRPKRVNGPQSKIYGTIQIAMRLQSYESSFKTNRLRLFKKTDKND